MQPFDFTTLIAVVQDLRNHWMPSRCEQVVQWDTTSLALALRTLNQQVWLTLSWHPQAARLHLGEAPPRGQDTFTFSRQLKHQLNQLALVAIEPIAPWERVLDLQFGPRPGDQPQWHLYVEIMGKYSNVILVNAQNQIVTAAHQVSEQQSRVRPIQTGDIYRVPPALMGGLPSRQESQQAWQDRLTLIPNRLSQMLMQSYAGLSSALVRSLLAKAELETDPFSDHLRQADWNRLFAVWQHWLLTLETGNFHPALTPDGYTMLGGDQPTGMTIHQVLHQYYGDQLNRQQFKQLKNQLQQRLKGSLTKLQQKISVFDQRLQESNQADQYRRQADLLMAYGHQWQPGLTQMVLEDFITGEAVAIAIDPDKTAIQQAQRFYKQHQKLNRARTAIAPLLAEVKAELDYLQQVEAALTELTDYTEPADLEILTDIRNELIQQNYLAAPDYGSGHQRPGKTEAFRHCLSPDGLTVLIGRNNRQNDQLVSSIATDYDLWFHSQEIPGSHVLLRVDPGQVASDRDRQYAADLAAYFSRARQADQVPVVYTQPRHLYKPRGARPGMVIYKQEIVIWGQPRRVEAAFS
ncbi:MAG: NFACT family protein [Nodosilinea sp. LVE1205-7]|jgi:predicted ribosome quality control (RQC) complex YloA/Tae2 family protein